MPTDDTPNAVKAATDEERDPTLELLCSSLIAATTHPESFRMDRLLRQAEARIRQQQDEIAGLRGLLGRVTFPGTHVAIWHRPGECLECDVSFALNEKGEGRDDQ